MEQKPSLSSGAERDATEAGLRLEEAAERVREWEREVDEEEATDADEAPSSYVSDRLLATSESTFLASAAGHLAVTLRSRNGHFRIPSFLHWHKQLLSSVLTESKMFLGN
jgi:hypothetical protein